MPEPDRLDLDRVLSPLKAFQKRSVDYVFDRLYGEDFTRHFLLADEVGLGKTLVARGVIARAIEHLRKRGVKRVDVVYICSNADIARQNISRLNVTGKPDFQLASRITLLPKTVHDLAQNALNFVSFTPGTSFDMGHSTGRGDERLLLYWLLRWTWPKLCRGAGAMNVMQGDVYRDRFRKWIRVWDAEEEIDADLAGRFTKKIQEKDSATRESGGRTFKARFQDLCERFGRSRIHIPPQDRQDRNAFIGEMRGLLAETCITALEPDLIILDEFQRFKELLHPDNEAGELAKHLFTWGEARVLLLSATPYKMYTLSHEQETDDHYKDFLETLGFLFDDDAKTGRMKGLLAGYSRSCARVAWDGVEPLRGAKEQVENELRRVMCRTEKLAVTEDRNGMLRNAGGPSLPVGPKHIRSYLETRNIAKSLGHPDVLDYWKASPYLLNFMEGGHYRLKRLLEETLDSGKGEAIFDVLSRSSGSVLDSASWKAYQEVDHSHALLERLAEQTVSRGWWRLLWIPPSFPYYELSGPYAGIEAASVTKRLIFSCWHVVPRAISVLLSYDAERRIMKGSDPEAVNTLESRNNLGSKLAFARSEGRLTGLPVLALLYPSMTLARLGDPLKIAREAGCGDRASLDSVLTTAAGLIREALAPLLASVPNSGQEDESWYWAAPILLDRMNHQEATETWFSDAFELASAWSGDQAEGRGWLEHVKHAGEVALGAMNPKRRPPRDLADVLALMAIAGPANCALRGLASTLSDPELALDAGIRHTAGRIAWGFRSLFNTPEITALLLGLNAAEPYWRRVLEYCTDGCLQSVLDEYLHLLVELEGLGGRAHGEAACQLAECVASSAGLHAATPGVDWVRANRSGSVSISNQRVRARFAMRFGDERGEQQEVRKDAVRAAFNSPFWPFVLATTSIGQEGLDFHPYCHAVVHWNLPSNPVDLEQREGRVHRYKGHAVRKNVARFVRAEALDFSGGGNPWPVLFRHAVEHAGGDSDISPYWVFPLDDGAFIERHTPTLPLSREEARLPALRASLAIYRMVFGQPRQDDLLEHLKRTVPEDKLAQLSRDLSVDLEPGPRESVMSETSGESLQETPATSV